MNTIENQNNILNMNNNNNERVNCHYAQVNNDNYYKYNFYINDIIDKDIHVSIEKVNQRFHLKIFFSYKYYPIDIVLQEDCKLNAVSINFYNGMFSICIERIGFYNNNYNFG